MHSSGLPAQVAWFERSWLGAPSESRIVQVDPRGVSAHLPDGPGCVWKMHGVWHTSETGIPVLDKPTYFTADASGRKYAFLADFWLPFVRKFVSGLREVHRKVRATVNWDQAAGTRPGWEADCRGGRLLGWPPPSGCAAT